MWDPGTPFCKIFLTKWDTRSFFRQDILYLLRGTLQATILKMVKKHSWKHENYRKLTPLFRLASFDIDIYIYDWIEKRLTVGIYQLVKSHKMMNYASVYCLIHSFSFPTAQFFPLVPFLSIYYPTPISAFLNSVSFYLPVQTFFNLQLCNMVTQIWLVKFLIQWQV